MFILEYLNAYMAYMIWLGHLRCTSTLALKVNERSWSQRWSVIHDAWWLVKPALALARQTRNHPSGNGNHTNRTYRNSEIGSGLWWFYTHYLYIPLLKLWMLESPIFFHGWLARLLTKEWILWPIKRPHRSTFHIRWMVTKSCTSR